MLFTGNDSMADYYSEVSYNQFTVAGQAQGWNRVSQQSTYYVNGYGGAKDTYPQNSQGIVVELVALADPVVDFSQYDNDSDGVVDALIVVYSGHSASADGSYQTKIWPHQWRLTGGSNGPGWITVDGVKIDTYLIVSELHGSSGTVLNKIGTFCHERWGFRTFTRPISAALTTATTGWGHSG